MKAVLWDLDDTLLNTLPARMIALAFAHEKCLGFAVDAEALWRSHRGGTLEQLGQRLLGADGLRFVETYRERYYGMNRNVRPFPGIVETLTALREHEIPMAVVTSKISWGAVEELEEADILQFFAAIIGVDDTEKSKPDPEPVLAALDRILVSPSERVLMVGDSPADIFAALNAGCTSVAATWGTLDEETLLDASPRVVIREPVELLAIRLEEAKR